MDNIFFFPEALPDETARSLVSRYHNVSGNLDFRNTLNQLFGKGKLYLDFVSARVVGLRGEIIPGDAKTNFYNLTLEPLYKVLSISSVGRNRNGVGAKTMAKLCQICAASDIDEYGVVYWRRSHQIPGVTVCWRHGVILIDKCPSCSASFHKHNNCLPSLSCGCDCGWIPNFGALVSFVAGEREFAIFAHELLAGGGENSNDDIYKIFLHRYSELKGASIRFLSLPDIYSMLGERYGAEFISSKDTAGRWANPSFGNLKMAPLSKKLFISFGLFGTADAFRGCGRELGSDVEWLESNAGSYRRLMADAQIKERIIENALTIQAEGEFPKRLSESKLLNGTGVGSAVSLANTYKSSFDVFSQLHESVDFYRLKRMLWTAGETRRLNISVSMKSFVALSKLNYRHVATTLACMGISVHRLCEDKSITIGSLRVSGFDNNWIMPNRVR